MKMRTLSLLTCITVVGFSSQAFAQQANQDSGDWQVSLGGGVLAVPEYQGSDEYDVLPVPYLDVKYKDVVTLNQFDGLRYHAIKRDGFNAGIGLGYDRGRDEDDGDRLNGMGDVDPTVEGQIFAGYSFGMTSAEVTFAHDLADGHEGYTVEAELGHAIPLNQYGAFVKPSVSTTYASENYMESYFGVSNAQSARSGLNAYGTDGGFKDVSAGLFAGYPLTKKWSVNALAKYSRLVGDAADSPVVEDEDQMMGGAFVAYKF